MSDPLGSRPLARQTAPRRPDAHPLRRRVSDWIRWYGTGRLIASCVSATLVVAGVIWVLRVPPPGATAPAEGPARVAVPSVPVVTLVGGPPPPTPETIVVHVAGAVAAPGVHELPAGSRTSDAVAAAGGATDAAVLDGVNLASFLVDGQYVRVPVEGETVVSPPFDAGGGPGDGVGPPSGPVDLNRASVIELERLPGVGPTIAAAIVEDRAANGPFSSVDELVRVRGIGPGKLETLRPMATV